MRFIADKCECCDDVALGILFSKENIQVTEDGELFLTMNRDDVGRVFTSIDHFIGGRVLDN